MIQCTSNTEGVLTFCVANSRTALDPPHRYIYQHALHVVHIIPFSQSLAWRYRRQLLLDLEWADWLGDDQTFHAHTPWNSNVKKGQINTDRQEYAEEIQVPPLE